uniref:Histidine kinase/HSP90-like ATPase domain-containing protein n=1 Tax=Chrysotila carterae TaxID=13221 RepID=A0A7S4BP30_CHRCT
MAPASEEEHKQGKAKAPHASVAPGWLQPPTAASQFPMSRWTLRFKDASMETAHRETLTKSPTLISVFTICNAVCLCAYCTGYMIDCKIIQANFLPLIMLNIPYQAFELCCFLRPTVPGQASFCDYLERLKFVWAGVVFAGLHLCSYLLSNEREEACGGGALTASCSHIGLVFDGNVVICTVLIPYVTQPSFALKLCISATVMAIHTLSPFWFPIQIELPAIGISVAVGNALGYVLEHSLRSTFREQHARLADQELLMQMKVAANMRLTHTIKGKCGTANSLAFAVISCLQGICIEQVQRALQLVHRMHFLLEEAEWWCNHRQLCVHLELGTYQTKRAACDVKARIEKLVGFDGAVNKCALASCSVDETVLGLAMDEALSNARQFRSPGTNIEISVQVEEFEGKSMLHVQTDSTNRANVPLLSAEQCLRVVQSGYKKHSLSAFSDGVGLTNVQQAAHAVGGRIWLQGYSSSSCVNHTVFHLIIPVDGIVWRREPHAMSDTEDDARETPGERSIFWSEEREEASSRLEEVHADPAQSRAATAVLETGSSQCLSPPSLPADMRNIDDPLLCLGLDDSSMCRQLHELLFSDFLEADMSRSASLGATVEEVESFVDVALGLKTTDLTNVPESERRAVDVVLIDQHLIVEDRRWLGSEIAQTLRARGFSGVICLMSGTVTEHLQGLQQQEVIDRAFSKGASPLDIADTIHELHEEKILGVRRTGGP